MNWTDASEVVTGLILEGKLSPNAVRHEIFMPPYDSIIKQVKNNRDWSIETLIETVGLQPVQSSVDSARELNGTKGADWVKILEESYSKYDAGVRLEKISRKLKKGDDIEWSAIAEIGKRAQEKLSQGIVGLDEVSDEGVEFIPTGWKPIDEHLGGIPEIGVIVVGAPPGTGKTTLMLKLAVAFVRQYPEKKVFIATLEMVKEELKARLKGMMGELTTDELSRIKVQDTVYSAEQIYNAAATIENLGMVMIDFVDLMISGENTESAMSMVYRTCMIGSKNLRVPSLVLSQMNRAGQMAGIPKPSSLRYSGMAEAFAWMIWMLYNPAKSWQDEEENPVLPILDDTAYIIVWKVRGGFRMHENDSPGAIAIPFKGKNGWGSKSKWFSLQKYS